MCDRDRYLLQSKNVYLCLKLIDSWSTISHLCKTVFFLIKLSYTYDNGPQITGSCQSSTGCTSTSVYFTSILVTGTSCCKTNGCNIDIFSAATRTNSFLKIIYLLLLFVMIFWLKKKTTLFLMDNVAHLIINWATNKINFPLRQFFGKIKFRYFSKIKIKTFLEIHF